MIRHIFANRSNVGDWLSARGIQSLLGLPCREYLCDTPFLEETFGQLSRAPAEDPIVIGGGGLFMDYFTPFWQGFLDRFGDRTFFIWGVGFVDLKQEESKAPKGLLTEVIARCRLCYLRDELSRRYLDAPLPDPVGCPSLLTLQPSSPAPGMVLHSANLTTVGQEAYRDMRSTCQAWAEETGRTFRETNNRIEAGHEQQLETTLQLYRQAELVVSSRLHGCIIALGVGRPVLAVSGDRKLESFMKDVGLQEWVIDHGEVDRLPSLLALVRKQPPPVVALERIRRANREVANEILSCLTGSD